MLDLTSLWQKKDLGGMHGDDVKGLHHVIIIYTFLMCLCL